ncbi:MAG: phosphoglucosamine mutase [Planctomycetes bacterium]|nr:phosphoglucosamine mutase [Planctomycetota bacterium]
MTETAFQPPVFGTDGLRGKAGERPMDRETMRRVGAALGLWLQQHGPEHKQVVIGHDGRASADWIGACLAQGLAATEVSVLDVGLIPTPGLALLTRTEPVVAGIMISASHNPSSDNGIKIFRTDGTKLPDQAEVEIARLTLETEFVDAKATRTKPRHELVRRYEEHLANLFADLDLAGRRIVIDAAHGAGSEIAPRVLRCFGAEPISIACAPDGGNINAGFGALHPEAMAEAVTAHGACLGISLDGDGDRCMFADQNGRVWDGDAVLTLMGLHLHERGELHQDTVVATVMSNLGLRRALGKHGVKVHVTPVGDRAVVAAMREGNYSLGGEQSGHIIFHGEGALTGDGLYTALRLLAVPGIHERGFAAAFGAFQSFPQLLVNVPVSSKPDLAALDAVQRAVAEAEAELGDDGRVVLRYSGTENLCRVMVEGPTEEIVTALTSRIADAVRQELAS